MYQQEIKFFFPLTEQIPLDLDYSNCILPNLITSIGLGSVIIGSFPIGSWGTTTSNTTTAFTLREDTTTMIVMKKPNLIRKWLFKMLGFKWEIIH